MPTGSAVGETPEVVLRMRGSNTIGAALAPALTEAFLRFEGAGPVSRVPMADGNGVQVSTALPGKNTPQVVVIESKGSTTAFEGRLDGSCDIGMSSRPIKAEEAAQLEKKGFGDMRSPASEHVIALDGIAVIVHPNNTTRGLTRPALARVFAGDVADWAGLGGPPGPISRLCAG